MHDSASVGQAACGCAIDHLISEGRDRWHAVIEASEHRLRPIALTAAFPRMHEGEDAYYATDLSMADLEITLSRTSPPLLAYRPARSSDATPLQGTVSLTEAGRAVLAGSMDRIATCGIDRWLGGVHLQGETGVWRWDAAQQKIRRW